MVSTNPGGALTGWTPTNGLWCTGASKLKIPPLLRIPNVWCRYSAVNKPVGVLHWLENSPDAQEVDYVLILDADQIVRAPILPWELGSEIGHPVSADYG